MSDPQESSRERKHDRVAAVESILESIDPALEEHAYPVNSEDLSAQYGETVLELPNETESLGSVFDRLEDDEYDSAMEAKEAVLRSVSDASPDPTVAGSDRDPKPGGQGAPDEVHENLASGEVAETAAEDASPDTPTEPDAEAAEAGDGLTPETTEADEFAPGDTVEDLDREGDGRAAAERSSGEEGTWEDAAADPGDPAEPTAEPTEAELEPDERGAEHERPGDDEPDSDGDAPADTDANREGGDGTDAVDVDYDEVVDHEAAEDTADDAADGTGK